MREAESRAIGIGAGGVSEVRQRAVSPAANTRHRRGQCRAILRRCALMPA